MNTKILSAFGIGMIAMLFLVSCQDEPSSSNKLTFKGVDLRNAKALALVHETKGSANAPLKARADGGEQDDPTTKFLYTVDENGNMSVAFFYFNEVDSTVNTQALRLSIENIFTVGDDYLWLYGCQYYCDNLDALPLDKWGRDYIQGEINASRNRPGHFNFLLRKTDGALFNISNINVVPLNSEGKLAVNYWPIENPTSKDLKQYGLVAQVGKELYWAIGNYQGGLCKLVDNGSTMDLVGLDYHANIAYIVGDGQGHLGTVLSYSSNVPTNPAFINGIYANLVQGLPNNLYMPNLHYIGGKYFISAGIDGDNSSGGIYAVSFDNGTATATLCVQGKTLPGYGYYHPVVVEGSTYSWLTDDGNSAIIKTFDANTLLFSTENLPEGFPSWEGDYDDEGNAYSAAFSKQIDMSYVDVYNLPTRTKTRHQVDRSEVPQYNVIGSAIYDRGSKAVIEVAIMADGSTVTLITPMTGEGAFKTVVMGTEASGTAVVATIVQLN